MLNIYFIYLGASFNDKGDTIKEVNLKEESSHSQKSQWRPAQDMEEQRATNPTEEKTRSINDLSYGSDTWIYLKSVQNMTNVFERWRYRRMLCISWTEHVTNEEVFNRVNTKIALLDGRDWLSMVT